MLVLPSLAPYAPLSGSASLCRSRFISVGCRVCSARRPVC